MRGVDDLVLLEGIRQTPVETGTHGGVETAELRHDGLLAFLHDEEAGSGPDQDCHTGDQSDTDARAARRSAAQARASGGTLAIARPAVAEQAVELVVEIAPELVHVRRALVVALRAARSLRLPVGTGSYTHLTLPTKA
mgnify:CR=1 FL=1